ncbi:PfkB family carbohydrate kinase [Maritalea sp.]|uniref:PfkB family carbohydrate kinase n=1 Tax=Maritalea sp. TaxID=2003361 RepID=UPI003EF8C65D
MTLTDLEARLLAQLKAQPFATQQELGEALGISRASVANYVERLQAKGLVLGRAYIFADASTISCIGGAVLDRVLRLEQPGIPQTSQPATSRETRGGVARNVAENLARLSEQVKLFSIVGNDAAGKSILDASEAAGVDTALVVRATGATTGTYTAIMEPSGDLYLGAADMGIFGQLDAQFIERHWQKIAASRLIFADTNCSTELLSQLITRCHNSDIPLAIDAVSIPKFRRLPKNLTGIEYLFCNMDEARAVIGATTAAEAANALNKRGVQNIIITDGTNPVTCFNANKLTHVEIPTTKIVDVSGAGDAFVAGFLHSILDGKSAIEATQSGVVSAGLTVRSELRNSPDLSAQIIAEQAPKVKIQRT